jgi:plasmid stabilization system protein ParE
MALTIYWSTRADNKFDKIISYINEEWGEVLARAFVKKVYEFLDILVEFPEIGSVERNSWFCDC